MGAVIIISPKNKRLRLEVFPVFPHLRATAQLIESGGPVALVLRVKTPCAVSSVVAVLILFGGGAQTPTLVVD